MAEENRTVREHSATIREAGGAATVRDTGNAETLGNVTVRDDPADAPHAPAAPQAAAGGWLPPSLAEDYRIVESLPAQGAEADIYVVEALSATAARRRIAKVYRQGTKPNPDVLNLLLRADPRHVVKVDGYGQCSESHRWWEIQEYVEHGSLRDLINRQGAALPVAMVMAILQELNDALGELHGLNMEHCDLKPSNVLVRSYDPLDLVLIDFGISSLMSATVHMTTASRTPEYAPPEAIIGNIEHTTWDYWSLGMMLVELLTGEHPFKDTHQATITRRLISAKNFDEFVESVSDPNWRKLCQGLLRREPSDRWDSEAISKWIANPEDPSLEVAEDASPQAHAHAGTPTIEFSGASYSNPADLGAALAMDWDKATSFWKRRFEDVCTWLHDDLGQHALGDAVAAIDDDQVPLDTQVFNFIYLLAPDAPLRFQDWELSLQTIGEISRLAADGDADADKRLKVLYEQRMLGFADALREQSDLGRLSVRWDEAVMEYESTRRELDSEGTIVPEATDSQLTLLLAASADSAVADQLRKQAHGARTETALLCPWFKDFGEPEDMSVAALVMIPHVQAAAERWNEDAKSQQRRAWVGGVIVGAFWGLVVAWADRGWGGIYNEIDGIGLHSFNGLIQCALVLFAFRWCRAWYWGWNDKLLYTFCLGPPVGSADYEDSWPIGNGGGISWLWAIGGLITFLLVTQIVVNIANVLTIPSVFLMRMLEWLVITALFAGESRYGSLGEGVHVVLNAAIGALVGYMVGAWGLRRRRTRASMGMGDGPDMGPKTSRWAIPIPASLHNNLRLVQAKAQVGIRHHPWQSLVVGVSAFVVLTLVFSLFG